MPIYEYQCQACKQEIEVIQKLSDAPLEDCPACGASALKKKVTAAAFRLKGSGWYETDFKSGNKKNLAGGAESGSESGSESAKSSDKPAADGSAQKSGSPGGAAKSGTAGSGESVGP
ncbi:MAG: zinc ribbon domain-containing protein [Halioglobus sp.]|nr:zinc ribbon domain-containing protein [Halioglobus sp.]